ncbi:MarR family winged helix-turn-helix transcriptional regulator [Phaeobacter sp. HF9A]|uniref:MarR family winged helix-turn-helix transcriptional regulator n=1 Tax=Phaeobacter sp. HF9A TaxID=2721561 RepID=UPI0034C5BB34
MAKHASKSPVAESGLDTQHLRLWLQMLKAVRSIEGLLRERLREEFGTTLPRFDVLATLYGMPEGLKMSQLSRHLVVSNGNVTGVVEKLVGEGLLERTNVETDRRAFLVRITPKGRTLMDEMTQKHREWVHEYMGCVSEADAFRAISIMIDIRHHNS